VLALSDEKLSVRLAAWREKQTASVASVPKDEL
jgi:phosphoribosylcarboxyaminoimidazole (NCAIR) mutase